MDMGVNAARIARATIHCPLFWRTLAGYVGNGFPLILNSKACFKFSIGLHIIPLY